MIMTITTHPTGEIIDWTAGQWNALGSYSEPIFHTVFAEIPTGDVYTLQAGDVILDLGPATTETINTEVGSVTTDRVHRQATGIPWRRVYE